MKKHYNIVQVGAHIGNDEYVARVLETGHNVIFIEPIKELFDKLVENHNKLRPNNNYIFLNKACSNYNGVLELHVPYIKLFSKETGLKYNKLGLPPWTDQLGSVLENHVKKHHINLDTKVIKIECVTLDSIIKEYEIESIDLLIIDTEGHDYEVLKGLNFNDLKPNIIIFEHKHIEGTNAPLGVKYNEIMKYFFSLGYNKMHMNSEDTHLMLHPEFKKNC